MARRATHCLEIGRLVGAGAAGLLAIASILTPAAALLPHEIQRLAAIPVGLALAWLGYALWIERRDPASEQASKQAPDQPSATLSGKAGNAGPQLNQAATE